MTPRPIRGIVIKQDRQIGAVLIRGSRTRTPWMSFGLTHTGDGVDKVYYGADEEPQDGAGIDYMSFRVNRPATQPITFSDPSTDKMVYMKYTQRAEHGSIGAEEKSLQLVNLEVDQRGIIGHVDGLYVSVRGRGTGVSQAALWGAWVRCQIDAGGTITTSYYGLNVGLRPSINAPAASAGIRIYNEGVGSYTAVAAALAIAQTGSSGCKGFKSLIDYEDDALNASSRSGVVIAEDGDAVLIITAGAPSDGDYNAQAKKGCLLIDTTNARLYMNVGTKASTDWDYVQTWTA